MDEATASRCSRCSAIRWLHVVIMQYDRAQPAGRLLVYCARCREEMRPDISIPVELMSADLFVRLYKLGLTSSAPDMAAKLVFGSSVPGGAVENAQAVLAQKIRKGEV